MTGAKQCVPDRDTAPANAENLHRPLCSGDNLDDVLAEYYVRLERHAAAWWIGESMISDARHTANCAAPETGAEQS